MSRDNSTRLAMAIIIIIGLIQFGKCYYNQKNIIGDLVKQNNDNIKNKSAAIKKINYFEDAKVLFFKQLKDDAKIVENQTGIKSSVILAIAAHQSNYGSNILVGKANNYYSINNYGWTGATYSINSIEYRKYENGKQSMLDFCYMVLKYNPKIKDMVIEAQIFNIINSLNVKTTSSDINKIIKDYDLKQIDNGI